ncbi:MAG: ribonuclease E/G [Hungatella sp.]|nr:ribonuclease E/G [Hungatella sp.]
MNKIIITKMNGQILTAMSNGSRIVQMHLEEKDSQSVLGNIYIGKVKNIAKNINAAFIDLGGQMAYYSLTENKNHLFTESLSSSSKIQRQLHAGDEIIVQVSKDAIKTKESVVTGNLSFTGRFCVVTAGRRQISFSSKISNEAWKAKLKLLLEEEKDKEFGIIVRTNAQSAVISDILEELRELKAQYYQLLSEADYRTCYTLLYKAVPSYISTLRDTYKDFMEEIVTDDKDIFQEIQEYLSAYQSEDAKKIRLYQDPLLPLGKLYSIEKAMDEALQKRVWLKSGGYLVIEPTEAMTVIDVNTGKYTGKKNLRDTIKKINFEAAVEIGYQLRLRNLSGIILIDFIDMDTKEDRQELMEILSDCCAKDPIKTTVVDMTKLGLVEVTRKKVRKPFREQVGKGEQKR